MTFHVEFSAEAEDNVRAIRDWIAGRSVEGARRWLDALDDATHRLAEEADRLPSAPEADAFDEPLKQVLFKTRRGNTFRAIFIVRETKVHVVAVRGQGQDLIRPGEIEVPE